MTAVDEDTVQFTLDVPDRLFLINGILSIISPEAYEQLGAAQFNSQPVGTGAFQFVEWLPEDHLTLEANPDYYVEGVPGLPGIHFMNYADSNTAALAYRANEVDFLFAFPTGQLTALKTEFAEEYNELPGLHVRYFGFDMVDGYLPKAARASGFNYALDRATALDIAAEGARFPSTSASSCRRAHRPGPLYDSTSNARRNCGRSRFPNGEG